MKGLINTWKKKFPGKGNKCKCLKAEISLACFKNRKKSVFLKQSTNRGVAMRSLAWQAPDGVGFISCGE